MLRTMFLILFGSLALSVSAFAQDSKSVGTSQIGGFVGNLLPNGVSGVEEIMPLWGLRYSYPIGTAVFLEGGGIFGHSKGVTWQSGFTSLRMDIPLETMVAFAIIGLDVTRHEGKNDDGTTQEFVTNGGGHAGGGLMSKIGGNVWTRFDMKLNSQPGTSLYFDIGIVFELGGAAAAQ